MGLPAGAQWEHQLRRSQRREALGDWRVHLRAGELAMRRGDLAEAEARWSWSYSLRPTSWADRNLALVELERGRADLASTRYLRAHRVQSDEIELGVEAVGVLLGAGRGPDARLVLDRMVGLGQSATARYWLLEAEVALATGRPGDAEQALAVSAACADASAHESWSAAVAASC